MQDRKDFRPGINDQPQPQDVSVAAQPGANFVQLQVRKVQVAKGALMEDLSVLGSACEPPPNGGVSNAEDAFSRGWVQPFGQREIRTMATLEEAVFSRYKAVSRRALKVAWQA
jgi:hypothetical protein